MLKAYHPNIKKEPNKLTKKAYQPTDLEAAFLYYWKALATDDIEQPIPQFQYFNYRLDYAFPIAKVAVELDGGRGGGYGRTIRCHACGSLVLARKSNGSFGKPLRVPYPSHSGAGAERDIIKQNLLVIGGWYPLRFSSAMLESDPAECIKQVIRLVGRLTDEKSDN